MWSLIFLPVYILAFAFAVAGLLLTLSFLFWYYEDRNLSHEEAQKRKAALKSGATDAMILKYQEPRDSFARILEVYLNEAFNSFISIATYPFGIRVKSPEPTPVPPGKGDDPDPVLCLHGYMMNRACMSRLADKIEQNFELYHIDAATLRPTIEPIQKHAEKMMERLDLLAKAWNAEKFQIVAHSMGGLIARYALAKLDGKRRISRVISVATPHKGSKLAAFAVGADGVSLLPGSDFFLELEEAEKDMPESLVPWICLVGRNDNMVVPYSNAIWEKADANLLVEGCGHLTFLYNENVMWIVGAMLTMPRWNEEHLRAVALPEGYYFLPESFKVRRA